MHRVVARGREYFYYQPGRGTDHAGPRIALPNDPHSPEFWNAIRQAQGLAGAVPVDTFGAVLDGYLEFIKTSGTITAGTIDQYERALRIGRKAWGSLPAKGLRPVHVQAVMDGLASKPGAANNFLSAMRALSTWARVRDHIEHSLTEGVKPYAKDTGHKPWTPDQIEAALSKLTGVIRRGVVLYMWTGMRGSDAVKLGWASIKATADGPRLQYTRQKTQKSNGVPVSIPIHPDLWKVIRDLPKDRPFLATAYGRGRTAAGLGNKMREWCDAAGLDECSAHGLRKACARRLAEAGATPHEIMAITGHKTLAEVQRYTQAALREGLADSAMQKLLARPNREQTVVNLAQWFANNSSNHMKGQ